MPDLGGDDGRRGWGEGDQLAGLDGAEDDSEAYHRGGR